MTAKFWNYFGRETKLPYRRWIENIPNFVLKLHETSCSVRKTVKNASMTPGFLHGAKFRPQNRQSFLHFLEESPGDLRSII